MTRGLEPGAARDRAKREAIVDYCLESVLLNVYKSNNIPILLLAHGKGTAKSVVYDILGYGGEKKTVSISVHTKNMTKYILKQINHHIDFKKPGTGIAFSIEGGEYRLCDGLGNGCGRGCHRHRGGRNNKLR